MTVRISTLAEVKVLSLASLMYGSGQNPDLDAGVGTTRDAINNLRNALGDASAGWLQSQKDSDFGANGERLFKTIGIARNIRIDEDYGTQGIYGIGAPTRPRLVPNNFSANVTVERLQLDRRSLDNFMTTPEYWYADDVQRDIGIDDFLLYTYFFVRSKEDTAGSRYRSHIYALMPRTSSVAYTTGDVMVANNISLTGFKYSYKQAFFDYQNLVNDNLTEPVRLEGGN